MSTRFDDTQIENLLGHAKARGSALRLRRRRVGELAVVLLAVCGSLAWGGPSLGATAPSRVVASSTVRAVGKTTAGGHSGAATQAVVPTVLRTA